jgi:hypothetical protein
MPKMWDNHLGGALDNACDRPDRFSERANIARVGQTHGVFLDSTATLSASMGSNLVRNGESECVEKLLATVAHRANQK